jgi:hypothetical protein
MCILYIYSIYIYIILYICIVILNLHLRKPFREVLARPYASHASEAFAYAKLVLTRALLKL